MEHRQQHAPAGEQSPGVPVGRSEPERFAGADARGPRTERELARVGDREVARPVEVEPGGVRTLVEASTGRRWEVREVDARGVPAAQAERCLIFDAETVVRRLWRYPPDWRRMPAEELLRLAAS